MSLIDELLDGPTYTQADLEPALQRYRAAWTEAREAARELRAELKRHPWMAHPEVEAPAVPRLLLVEGYGAVCFLREQARAATQHLHQVRAALR